MSRYHTDPENISRYKKNFLMTPFCPQKNFLMIPFCEATSHATLVVLSRGYISRSGGVQQNEGAYGHVSL